MKFEKVGPNLISSSGRRFQRMGAPILNEQFLVDMSHAPKPWQITTSDFCRHARKDVEQDGWHATFEWTLESTPGVQHWLGFHDIWKYHYLATTHSDHFENGSAALLLFQKTLLSVVSLVSKQSQNDSLPGILPLLPSNRIWTVGKFALELQNKLPVHL